MRCVGECCAISSCSAHTNRACLVRPLYRPLHSRPIHISPSTYNRAQAHPSSTGICVQPSADHALLPLFAGRCRDPYFHSVAVRTLARQRQSRIWEREMTTVLAFMNLKGGVG